MHDSTRGKSAKLKFEVLRLSVFPRCWEIRQIVMLWIEFKMLTWQATFGSIIFSLFLLNLHGRLNMVKTCRQSYKKIWVLSEAANSSNIEKLLKILATKNYKSKVQSEKEERKAYIIQSTIPRRGSE